MADGFTDWSAPTKSAKLFKQVLSLHARWQPTLVFFDVVEQPRSA